MSDTGIQERARDEYVMVLPTTILMEVGYFQGLSFDVTKYIHVMLESGRHTFLRRRDAEVDPNYKQLIPYVIFRSGNDIFTYRRGRTISETRLAGNYSIGIGGHITVSDSALFGLGYAEGLRREVAEEIEVGCTYDARVAALINDDTDDVGRVHLGIVHVAELSRPSIAPKEKSIRQARFCHVRDLKSNTHKFENWSKICIRQIDDLLRQGQGEERLPGAS